MLHCIKPEKEAKGATFFSGLKKFLILAKTLATLATYSSAPSTLPLRTFLERSTQPWTRGTVAPWDRGAVEAVDPWCCLVISKEHFMNILNTKTITALQCCKY